MEAEATPVVGPVHAVITAVLHSVGPTLAAQCDRDKLLAELEAAAAPAAEADVPSENNEEEEDDDEDTTDDETDEADEPADNDVDELHDEMVTNMLLSFFFILYFDSLKKVRKTKRRWTIILLAHKRQQMLPLKLLLLETKSVVCVQKINH